MNVEVGKDGRIVLPKELRERHGVREKTRLIVRERGSEIILIPVKRYDDPTEALYGSIKLDQPIDDPKSFAREYIRAKLKGETA